MYNSGSTTDSPVTHRRSLGLLASTVSGPRNLVGRGCWSFMARLYPGGRRARNRLLAKARPSRKQGCSIITEIIQTEPAPKFFAPLRLGVSLLKSEIPNPKFQSFSNDPISHRR